MCEEEKPMPGYTGYRPQFENDNVQPDDRRNNRFYIPGKKK